MNRREGTPNPLPWLKTVVTQKFPRKAALRITLDLIVRRGGRDDIEVLVGGLRARRAGNSRVYVVSVERTTIAQDGTLSLVLR